MARYRRTTRRTRRTQSVQWQPAYLSTRLAIPAGTVGSKVNGVIAYTVPGTVDKDGSIDGFDENHTLERMRGAVAHDGSASASTPNANTWFPFILAAAKIPKGLDVPSDGLDLFATEEIEDLAFCHNAICDANGGTTPNWEHLDSKGKRRFEVGDRLAWLWSLITPIAGAFNIDVVANVRILWRLRT